ncbi:cytoplasmic polyadenylation element-binding protein 1-like [Galendromus occidentalis]|uniref:Cytoplasmic polyadenylation element-binding protein 1-like n=1 Tax=Galendromus occidentalis TaxID=34638 RepID=A0AAJ6VUU3_9ACAR|nr:cytoplasmic polyadenylation element-binding protein 1-like [Galendromus occidentalis]
MTWSERGYQLPRRHHQDATYSRKVFIGGLPPDFDSAKLVQSFQGCGSVRAIKKPGKGHAYIILESNDHVKSLLSRCQRSVSGDFYFSIVGRATQVIPWAEQDSEWGTEFTSPRTNTIFVGALHGQTTAEHVKIIMEDRFGQVRFVKIDTDSYNYPNGSARVQFVFHESYCAAINVNILRVVTKDYERNIQLEPFFEKNIPCSRRCGSMSSVICRHYLCLQYFCRACHRIHQNQQSENRDLHKPIGLL